MDAIRIAKRWPCIAISSIFLALSSSLAVQAETLTTAPFVTVVSEVSQEFRDEVELAWRSIPRAIRIDLVHQGWQLKAAKFVVQAEPTLIDQQPRGWPRDFTWWHTEAAHLPKQRVLIVAEKLVNKHGQVVKTDRAGRVLCHEIGHAFDKALTNGRGWESSNTSFIRCYARDMARLDAESKTSLNYFTQAGKAGRQEAFAEAFAHVVSGQTETAADRQFVSAFPSVMRYVQSKVDPPTPRVATAADTSRK